MIEHAKKAPACRQRAEELRTVAGTRDEATREVFLKLADEYDRLALEHEQIAALSP
jgi:hypothetical protein